ncbi:MAG: hypothetical protein ACLP6E_08880 [Acidimicrobiales bacterium]
MQHVDLPPDPGNVLRRDLRDRGLEHLGKRGVTAVITDNYIAFIHVNNPSAYIHGRR